jgi:hypothetical protein
MNEQKYSRYCGAANLLKAAFCANCGRSFAPSQSPQHISGKDEPPYLEDEILNKVRRLVLPITGKKTLLGGAILVILFYSARIAGGWFNTANNAGAATVTPTPIATATYAPSAETPTSNPTAQATSKPTATPKATPDNTAAEVASLRSYLISQGRPLVSVLFILHALQLKPL